MSYLKAKITQFDFGWASAPDPTEKLTAISETPSRI